uniref:SRP9 domain-containing protein n=1 Tax=Mycena chlorophos TaxID=658473 RepID=A0ABQ0LCU9_MYCCL|nr:predicted protein [Mycena chlorophos]
MYIHGWQEYQEKAEELYAASPNKTRYCVKWREGKLVLKITDNTTCLKFKTSSSVFLNRFEALNLALIQKMQNRRPPAPQTHLVAASVPATKAESPAPEIPAAAPSSAVPTAGGPAAGGVKKKKPKKKK